jgi:hypothetical protein
LTPKISREVEITIDKLLAMIDTKRVATRYAQQTMDEEHLEILKELLNMEDAQLTDDERDNSTDLINFNFNL